MRELHAILILLAIDNFQNLELEDARYPGLETDGEVNEC
jgi:hypothetical protein